MATTHRYNSLGQILAAGGEISLGLLIARGASQADLAYVIATRYPGLPPADARQLLSISAAGVEAGQRISEQQLTDMLDLDLIPIQSSLFGQDPQGRRIALVAEYTDPASGKASYVFADLAVEQTIQEMKEYLAGLIAKYKKESPRFAERLQSEMQTLEDFEFTFAERRY